MTILLTRIYNKIKQIYNISLSNIQTMLSNLGTIISQSDHQISMHQNLDHTKVISGACFLEDKKPLSNFIANQDNVDHFMEHADSVISLRKQRTRDFEFADFNHFNVAIDNTDGSRVVMVKVFGYSLQDAGYNCLYTFLCPPASCINQTTDLSIPITLKWDRDLKQFGYIEITGVTTATIYGTANYYPFPAHF